jgi:hypothetical protein
MCPAQRDTELPGILEQGFCHLNVYEGPGEVVKHILLGHNLRISSSLGLHWGL